MSTINETLDLIMSTIDAPTISIETKPTVTDGGIIIYTNYLIIDLDAQIKPMFDPFELGQRYYELYTYLNDLNESSNYCTGIRDMRVTTMQKMLEIDRELAEYGYNIVSHGGPLELSVWTDIDTYTAENVFEDDHKDYLNAYTVIKTYGQPNAMQDHTPEYNDDGEDEGEDDFEADLQDYLDRTDNDYYDSLD